MAQFTTATGQKILKDEVENVIHLMKNGKATGPDDLPGEALKSLDEHNVDIINTVHHNLQHWVYTNRNETINICTNTQETKSTKFH